MLILVQRSVASLLLVAGAGALTLVPPAGADWMGEFFPLYFGSSWTYENRDIPGDTYTESVFEVMEYEGHPAVRIGIDIQNHTIAHCDGQTVTVFAEVEDGVLYDLEENVVVGEFQDGYVFRTCMEVPCDSLLVRVWDNLDPILRSIYEVDPAPGDLILLASYDRNYTPNFHNMIVASNLPSGITPPAGAVTGLEWYWRDVGTYGLMDIDAQSGGMLEPYFLVAYSVSVEEPQDAPRWLVLGQNFPNPFDRATTIRCQTPAATFGSISRPAMLRIYDSTGRTVRSLGPSVSSRLGSQAYVWDGCDEGGRSMPSGTYFYRLETGATTRARRMLLLR